MAIPRVIHYFWFGDKEKGELEQRCIASWKKYCPDCKIIEWNEKNYDVTKNRYMLQAYQAKRWGFVSDYARLDIIYEYGGIYLDTDVELIRGIEDLFQKNGFIGFEKSADKGNDVLYVNTGQGFGAEPKNQIIKRMLDVYDKVKFLNDDGTYNLRTCPYYNTEALASLGLEQRDINQKLKNFSIYSTEYFCPLNWESRKCEITKNTYSIHHFNASWLSQEEKKKRKKERVLDHIVHTPNRILVQLLGKRRYEWLKRKLIHR